MLQGLLVLVYKAGYTMKELILVRHGETESNNRGTFLGWTDVELNEAGIRQAYAAREKLKDIKFDAVYSSPLKRVRATAEIIYEGMSPDIIFCNELKERNFGIWDNLTYSEIQQKYPLECEAWGKDWLNYCIDKGESALAAHNRITDFIDSLVKDSKDERILLVTHLGCIRTITAHLLGLPMEGAWRFRVGNGSITRLEVNNEGFAYLTMLNG